MVRGEVEVRDRKGELFRAGPRMALCRCGESKNHPFCDLSHVEAGFRNYPRAVAADRAAAESPDDVGPELPGGPK
jgi:CDGSH-type Zn-finger protein